MASNPGQSEGHPTRKVVAICGGAGATCRYRVLSSAKAAAEFRAANLLRSGIQDAEKVSAAYIAKLWADDRRSAELVSAFTSDKTIGLGMARVTPEDKWLIIFGPNCEAAWKGELGVVKRTADMDAVVKRRYMADATPDDFRLERGGANHGWNWKVPTGPLDWTGKTTYSCIKPHFRDQSWGWADSKYAPFLFDCAVNSGGEGIHRFDLDTLPPE